ncbi:hypothetical protein [Lacticaseibacillus mingshuiensis]|uniref:Uncharacterized protein n=1 Tax=Lacticaseibacillus mingshuiensis TaxID=2799574 RepID=A0ABW4CLG6_9LACO|nr:hypothetical protein [Lacticaseibacillus mingshuiensis]
MTRPVKVAALILLGLLMILPALALTTAIVALSLFATGLAAVGIGSGLLVAVSGTLAGVLLVAAGMLIGLQFIHFHQGELNYVVAGARHHLPVCINLAGRTICRHIWAKERLFHSQGEHLFAAIEHSIETYFAVDLRDYLLHQAADQHGVAVIEVMALADEEDFHFSL